ncbi:MAG: tetratricopeptide repeat protein [Bryobacteraceae bacterium]
MRMYVYVVAFLLVAGSGMAQRHQLTTIDTETPEGQLLQQIGLEEDAEGKRVLLEKFVQEYPGHDAAGWVYTQLQAAYLKANQPDKVIETGEKLLALDADDLEAAHNNLKASEAKQDSDLIRNWAGETSKLARKAAQAPKPDDEDEADAWKRSVDYARQVDTYTNYSLYAAAMREADPVKVIALSEALEAQSPESEYIPQLRIKHFAALRQLNETEKAVQFAEKIFETDQSNEDMLLVAADYYMQSKKEPDKVFSYSAKIIELMESKPKPEGVSDEEWEKKKKTSTGLAHWMTGVLYANQGKFAQADKSLRAALPFIDDNDQLKAGALFFLGLANFKLGDTPKGDPNRIIDALKFNQECAAIKSPYQAQARKNVAAIRSQYRFN